MTMTEWISYFQPIRNPERPQSDSAYGFRCCMFDSVFINQLDDGKHDPYKNHRIWSLVRYNGKLALVNGFHPNTSEGYFMARIDWDRDYKITALT